MDLPDLGERCSHVDADAAGVSDIFAAGITLKAVSGLEVL